MIVWDAGLRGAARPEPCRVAGLRVLRARVAPGGYWEKRRLTRAARALVRQGVDALLPAREGRGPACAIPAVDPLPLYRAMAGPLALALLTRRGIPARRACVLLRGNETWGELAGAARSLCPEVGRLILDAPGGERLAGELYARFGAAVCPAGAARPDLLVCFDGPGEDGALCLGREDPCLCGLRLDAPTPELPEELEREGVLAALWRAGLLAPSAVRVLSGEKSLDIRE